MKANNFDVMKVMSERNMNIMLAPIGTNFVRAKQTKLGTEVTMGCPDSVLAGLLAPGQNFVGGLILADKTQFEQVKTELESE